jgi:hypothetical protein
VKSLVYALLAVIALFALVVPVTVAAVDLTDQQQADLPPQLDYVDAQLNVLLPRLVAYQDMYIAQYGGYYQELGSHSLAPTGADDADRLEEHPTDQLTTLERFWSYAGLPESTNFALEITTYEGPDGNGYVLNVSTTVLGVLWHRSINYGPETYREQAWYCVEPMP